MSTSSLIKQFSRRKMESLVWKYFEEQGDIRQSKCLATWCIEVTLGARPLHAANLRRGLPVSRGMACPFPQLRRLPQSIRSWSTGILPTLSTTSSYWLVRHPETAGQDDHPRTAWGIQPLILPFGTGARLWRWDGLHESSATIKEGTRLLLGHAEVDKEDAGHRRRSAAGHSDTRTASTDQSIRTSAPRNSKVHRRHPGVSGDGRRLERDGGTIQHVNGNGRDAGQSTGTATTDEPRGPDVAQRRGRMVAISWSAPSRLQRPVCSSAVTNTWCKQRDATVRQHSFVCTCTFVDMTTAVNRLKKINRHWTSLCYRDIAVSVQLCGCVSTSNR